MAYNGLNQREFYHDAGGINHYNSYDGAEPGAALLSDGVNTYTPGISQHSAAAGSSFYISDAQGSLRGIGTRRSWFDSLETLLLYCP